MSRPPYGRTVRGNRWTDLDGEAGERRPVSVIVAHYEQEPQLARTLLALSRQTYPADLIEVIVVDDGSSRPPCVPAGVTLRRQARCGARRARARNQGVAASHGELLCFLDADTVPEPDYLSRLCRLPNPAPESVTVGRRRHAALSSLPAGVDITEAGPATELPAPQWLSRGYETTADLRAGGPDAFRFMISATLATSRWFFDEVGGFDESFRAYGGEDWEWAHRAWLSGAIFAHVPTAVAWHDGPDWAGRAAASDTAGARQEKNAEAIQLAGLVNVAGHRPRGLLPRRAQTVVSLPADLDLDAVFITVDSLLAALPGAAIRLPVALPPALAADPRVFSDARPPSAYLQWPALHIEVTTGVEVMATFRSLCESFLDEDAGSWRLHDASGQIMLLESGRHRRRRERWGAEAVAAVQQKESDALRRLGGVPDVEAYLGGWQR